MSLTRKLILALLALFLLLAGALTWLVASFDANRYKGLAIDWMKSERQRTLAIDGPIELSVFPRLAVKASKLRLSERARADEFVAVDEAALSVQVLPLLRKQLVIDRVSARGVRAAYSRDAKGVSNIDDFFAAGAPAQAPQSGPALRLDIGAVQLENVQLRLRDDLAKLAGEIGLQSFTSGRLANMTETPVALKARVALTRPKPVDLTLDVDTYAITDFHVAKSSLLSKLLPSELQVHISQVVSVSKEKVVVRDNVVEDAAAQSAVIAAERAAGAGVSHRVMESK